MIHVCRPIDQLEKYFSILLMFTTFGAHGSRELTRLPDINQEALTSNFIDRNWANCADV